MISFLINKTFYKNKLKEMILLIDASITKTGGALTHLISLSKYYKHEKKIKKIIIYAPLKTLNK